MLVNGESITTQEEQGYINVNRVWQPNDRVEIILPMPIRRALAHTQIADCQGKVALERGPIVYAAEGIDNGGHALDIVIPDDMPLTAEYRASLLHGVTVITGNSFVAIPYYAWSHRGTGEMAVWFTREK